VPRMPADELAFKIVDDDRETVLVDVRDAVQFAKSSLPRAVNMQPATMLGKEWRDVLAEARKRKVFFAQDEATAVRAATLASLLGYRNLAVLEGGLAGFDHTILQAPASVDPGVDAVTARFRARAGVEIATLIKQRGAVKTERRIKKVQGGCGS